MKIEKKYNWTCIFLDMLKSYLGGVTDKRCVNLYEENKHENRFIAYDAPHTWHKIVKVDHTYNELIINIFNYGKEYLVYIESAVKLFGKELISLLPKDFTVSIEYNFVDSDDLRKVKVGK